MPKKRRRDSAEKQSQRFVETARKLGVDETGESFERALKIISPPTKGKKRKAASP
jgi:hypothetical protein